MLHVLIRSGLLLPGALAIAALLVLIGLGGWQWQRMQWKQAVLAQLAAAATAPARDYGTVRLSALPSGEPGRYTPVSARGRYHHDKAVRVFWTRGSRPGFLVLTPFVPLSGRPILVNRGFVPEHLADRVASSAPEGVVEVRGLLVRRDGSESMFTPDPDLARRTWYAIRPAEIAARLDLDVLPTHTLDLDQRASDGGWPRAASLAERIAAIPNRHFEYALTWWGLALTLVGVFAVFAYGRLKAAAG